MTAWQAKTGVNMAIGDSTVAAVNTGGKDVRFSDIQHWCTQDASGIWSLTPPNTESQVAAWLNADFRHQRDTTISEIWRVIGDELVMAIRLNGSVEWTGLFPAYHNSLPNSGQRNKLLLDSWRRLVQKGQQSEGIVPCYTDAQVQEGQTDNRNQRAGLVVAEWNEVCQDSSEDPTYDPDNFTGYKNNPTLVYDLWQSLTGGRRFGQVEDTDVAATIARQNDDESAIRLSQRQTNAQALAIERQTPAMDEATLQTTWNQAWTDAGA